MRTAVLLLIILLVVVIIAKRRDAYFWPDVASITANNANPNSGQVQNQNNNSNVNNNTNLGGDVTFGNYCQTICDKDNTTCLGYYDYGSNYMDGTCEFKGVAVPADSTQIKPPGGNFHESKLTTKLPENSLKYYRKKIPNSDFVTMIKNTCDMDASSVHMRYDPIFSKCMMLEKDVAPLFPVAVKFASDKSTNYMGSPAGKMQFFNATDMVESANARIIPPIKLMCHPSADTPTTKNTKTYLFDVGSNINDIMNKDYMTWNMMSQSKNIQAMDTTGNTWNCKF